MYLGAWNYCDGVFFKEQKSPPRFASYSRIVSQIRLFQVTYETAYGCPYHPKANVCFVAVMETFPLVKQIFRAERNIWAARMCQNRTDACLLKTQLKKKKKPPCTWLLGVQPQWVKQEIRYCRCHSNPSSWVRLCTYFCLGFSLPENGDNHSKWFCSQLRFFFLLPLIFFVVKNYSFESEICSHGTQFIRIYSEKSVSPATSLLSIWDQHYLFLVSLYFMHVHTTT